MINRHDDTPEINDYTYYVFEEIEKRGLQFAIPPKWRPVYRAFLKERKRKREVATALQGIARAFELSNRSGASSYSQDFGDKNSTPTEEDPKTD